MRLLEPGQLEQDYAITTCFENKRFSVFFFFFFGKRANKIQDSAMQPLKTLVLDLSDLSGNGPQIHESYSGPFFLKKKNLSIFCFKKLVIG